MNLATIALRLLLTAPAGLMGYVYYRSRIEFGPGRTVEETAHILVHDFKFGRRGVSLKPGNFGRRGI